MHRQLHGFIIAAGKERGGVVERLRNLDRVGKKGGEFSCQLRFLKHDFLCADFLKIRDAFLSLAAVDILHYHDH